MTKTTKKFYPLEHEEWLRARRELTPSQRDVLYYLRTLEPYGRAVSLKVTAIAKGLGCDKGTVSRALKVLDAKGWIELDLLQVQIRVSSTPDGNPLVKQAEANPPAAAPPPAAPELVPAPDVKTRCAETTSCSETTGCDPTTGCAETTGCEATTTAIATQPPRSPDNRRDRYTTTAIATQHPAAETETRQGFQIPKISKDHLDHLDSLSEAARESFQQFCEQKMNRVPFAIASRTAWLAKHWPEYWAEFECRYPETVGQPLKAPALSSDARAAIEQAIIARDLKTLYHSETLGGWAVVPSRGGIPLLASDWLALQREREVQHVS